MSIGLHFSAFQDLITALVFNKTTKDFPFLFNRTHTSEENNESCVKLKIYYFIYKTITGTSSLFLLIINSTFDGDIYRPAPEYIINSFHNIERVIFGIKRFIRHVLTLSYTYILSKLLLMKR